MCDLPFWVQPSADPYDFEIFPTYLDDIPGALPDQLVAKRRSGSDDQHLLPVQMELQSPLLRSDKEQPPFAILGLQGYQGGQAYRRVRRELLQRQGLVGVQRAL